MEWAIVKIVELLAEGERAISIINMLKSEGITITRPTVYRILKEVAKILREFEFNFVRVKVSNEWQIDDMWMKIKGKVAWITNVMDVGTRYWLAGYVSASRGAEASRMALSYARTICEKCPNCIKCDGYQGHKKAINELFNVRVISIPKSCLLYTSPSPRDRG